MRVTTVFMASKKVNELGEERGERREIERDRESIESREYNYRHITISEKREFSKAKRYQILHLYVKKSRLLLHDQMQRIMQREGKSFSEFLWDAVESYVRLHEPGNPQQRLDVIMKLGKAYHAPNPICGFKDCLRDVVVVAVFQKTKETYGLCEVHRKEAEELGPQVWRFMKQC